MARFSLSWESHKNNICYGLSTLQQNGEFVDMTLAADGHFVKVHRMIMSLVSPYIKDLLSSAPCNHPIIFLNKISYATLCAILEYTYSGEVLVDKTNLPELIEAGKALGIQGLQQLEVEMSSNHHVEEQGLTDTECSINNSTPSFTSSKPKIRLSNLVQKQSNIKISKTESLRKYNKEDTNFLEASDIDDTADHNTDDEYIKEDDNKVDFTNTTVNQTEDDHKKRTTKTPQTLIQYTLSNQGALQLIVNRYIYFLRYTSRKAHGHRQWRCTDYAKKKCQAFIITRDDIVIQRTGAHSHPFHDKQILKRVQKNAVFTALTEAEKSGNCKKLERQGIMNTGDGSDSEK